MVIYHIYGYSIIYIGSSMLFLVLLFLVIMLFLLYLVISYMVAGHIASEDPTRCNPRFQTITTNIHKFIHIIDMVILVILFSI
jgi:hypothetical protein